MFYRSRRRRGRGFRRRRRRFGPRMYARRGGIRM